MTPPPFFLNKKQSRCTFASFYGDRESLKDSLTIVSYCGSYSSTIGCFITRYLYESSEGVSYVLTTAKKWCAFNTKLPK